jgi:hypothetical protein
MIKLKNQTVRCLAVPLLAMCLGASAWAWSPPEKPNVDQILNEARQDQEAKRFEDAAAKHRWYHGNVLQFEQSHGGVRLSFALSDWHRLARVYPPALRDMQDARDKAIARVRDGSYGVTDAMGDLVALNEQLEDAKSTADLAAWLDANRPSDARRFASQTLAALVKVGSFDLAAKHLDLEAVLRQAESHHAALNDSRYRSKEDVEASRSGTNRYIDWQFAPTILTLVKAGKHNEAQAAVQRLRKILGSGAVTHLSNDALRGFAPPFGRSWMGG